MHDYNNWQKKALPQLEYSVLFGLIMLLGYCVFFFVCFFIISLHASSQNSLVCVWPINLWYEKLPPAARSSLTIIHFSVSSHSAVWLCQCRSPRLSVCYESTVFSDTSNFWAGVATFQCSDTVVFVFVFAIPVCLDPCDPVDCGNSVPPCHSEPVWRDDLVSRTQTD